MFYCTQVLVTASIYRSSLRADHYVSGNQEVKISTPVCDCHGVSLRDVGTFAQLDFGITRNLHIMGPCLLKAPGSSAGPLSSSSHLPMYALKLQVSLDCPVC